MTWKMGVEEEVTLEKIWELHDRISDAIHAVSRSQFLNSTRYSDGKKDPNFWSGGGGGGEGKDGFVFVKGFEQDEDAAAISDVRSLDGIRTALEDLEDRLEFFHTVQAQQQTERDAAIARLEQSRKVLAMRLSCHRGKKFSVIEEALSFIHKASDGAWFTRPPSQPSDDQETNRGRNPTVRIKVKDLLTNAAVFAVSALLLVQINSAAPSEQQRVYCGREEGAKLDVWAARG
ncbi:plastid division protein PDV1-like [Wolffia australiana]